MKNKIIGYYSFFLGLSIIGMWTMILLTEEIPEGKTEMSFHLTSEFLMALICIVGGLFRIMNRKYAKIITAAGFGMVIYSVINAAGYYAERGNFAFASLFVVILVITTIAAVFLIKEQ